MNSFIACILAIGFIATVFSIPMMRFDRAQNCCCPPSKEDWIDSCIFVHFLSTVLIATFFLSLCFVSADPRSGREQCRGLIYIWVLVVVPFAIVWPLIDLETRAIALLISIGIGSIIAFAEIFFALSLARTVYVPRDQSLINKQN